MHYFQGRATFLVENNCRLQCGFRHFGLNLMLENLKKLGDFDL